LKEKGVRFFPIVGWAERGGYLADGHGNSVPRFHITWGTGPGLLKPSTKELKEHIKNNRVDYFPRHRVSALNKEGHRISGLSGEILAESQAKRGEKSNRDVIDYFQYKAKAILVSSGGIGGNLDLVRDNWPERLGPPPKEMISGVPDHVDGRMLEITEKVGGRIVNRDRMWHYTEGIKNWNSVWPKHGIRILPGPSSLWFDAEGNRFQAPNFPGYDTLGTLEAIQKTGYDYSWFILNESIIEKEFALSGSEQNPDLTGKSIRQVLGRIRPGAPGPVQAFMDKGEDFIVKDNLKDLVQGMNELIGEDRIDYEQIKEQIKTRDLAMNNKFTKDLQVASLRVMRGYLGDKLIRVAKPHKILDKKQGPLIAVRLNLLSRKTLGGLQINLDGQVLNQESKPIPGLYAAGEVTDFGGIHGYRSLEGTFLGGCLFTGREAGRAIGRL